MSEFGTHAQRNLVKLWMIHRNTFVVGRFSVGTSENGSAKEVWPPASGFCNFDEEGNRENDHRTSTKMDQTGRAGKFDQIIMRTTICFDCNLTV